MRIKEYILDGFGLAGNSSSLVLLPSEASQTPADFASVNIRGFVVSTYDGIRIHNVERQARRFADQEVTVTLAWKENSPKESSPSTSCECGSGSDEPSGAHFHWCRLWMAP